MDGTLDVDPINLFKTIFVGKFRIMPYFEIFVRGQNPEFVKKWPCLSNSMT